MEHFNFTAIDFETMTAERTSACAIGFVRVENDVIVQKFYSLIKPIRDERTSTNVHVHGITTDMVSNAPTWKELWPSIRHYFEGQIIVCHNADFDLDVLDKISTFYGIDFSIYSSVDTMMITHCSLADACALADIPLENHHDALCDATACAKILLTCWGVRFQEPHFEKMSASSRRNRKLSHEAKKPLEAGNVENKETPFFQKKVVLTGILNAFPVREEIANLLKSYGADINSSISRKTDIVIVGEGYGPSKMKKIEELRGQGCEIQVLYEPEFLEILEKYNIR